MTPTKGSTSRGAANRAKRPRLDKALNVDVAMEVENPVQKNQFNGEGDYICELPDGSTFRITREAAKKSVVVESVIENFDLENKDEKMIPITNSSLHAAAYRKALTWCLKNANRGELQKDVRYENMVILSVDDRNLLNVPWDEFFEIFKVADYLNIPDLLSLCGQKIATHVERMTTEELREFFGIENDFTEEEEREFKEKFAFVDRLIAAEPLNL